MRRFVLLLLCLCSLTGCHYFGHKGRSQAALTRDPERRDSVSSMSAAEKEAQKQLSTW
jgi:hypothetical protein